MLSLFSVANASSSAAPSAGIGASVAGFVPLILIFGVFYFLVIRPQQKKLKEHARLLEGLKKGDKIVAAGGIHGSVTKVSDSNGTITLEIASGVEIKVQKSSVSEVLNKDQNAGNGKQANSSTNTKLTGQG
ncbi:MAG: preprotein translocase subunit YajC [Aaplasma endosymbiont of Hyalomma asiaticum]